MAKKRKIGKKCKNQIPEYIIAEDGRMYRVNWKKWGNRAVRAGKGAGRGAVTAGRGAVIAGKGVGRGATVTPHTRQALIDRAKNTASALDQRLAAYISGDNLSPYIEAAKNSPSAIDKRLANYISGGKMPRGLPEYIENDDGKMYRIDWKETAKFAVVGAGLDAMAAHASTKQPQYGSDESDTNVMYRAMPQHMSVNDRFMYPFSGDTADAISTDYGVSKYASKKPKKEDVFDDGDDILALAKWDTNVSKYYRAMPEPEPVLPPSVVMPSFGGNKKPKPPGFMPRMPGQRRRKR